MGFYKGPNNLPEVWSKIKFKWNHHNIWCIFLMTHPFLKKHESSTAMESMHGQFVRNVKKYFPIFNIVCLEFTYCSQTNGVLDKNDYHCYYYYFIITCHLFLLHSRLWSTGSKSHSKSPVWKQVSQNRENDLQCLMRNSPHKNAQHK